VKYPFFIHNDCFPLRDALKGETIGMIVGIVLAVVLVVFVVLLLLFARATGRWCFADDEYGYQDPMDPKRRPRTQAQVYRFRSHSL
jgi:hypothetical protein